MIKFHLEVVRNRNEFQKLCRYFPPETFYSGGSRRARGSGSILVAPERRAELRS